MKKILLSVAGLLMLGLCANAQPWSFGPKAGAIFSTINNVEGAKARTGIVAGVFAERMVNDWFSLQTELLYSMQGVKFNNADVNGKYHLDYITMPVLAKFYLISGLNLQLGAQFGYLVDANQTVDDVKSSITGQVNRYNVGLFTGIAYDFDFGLILEGRYNIGLTDVFVGTGSENLRAGNLQIAAAWRF